MEIVLSMKQAPRLFQMTVTLINSRPDTGRLTSCHQQTPHNHQIYIQKDVLLIPVFIFIFILIKKSITFKYLEFTVINNKTQNKYN